MWPLLLLSAVKNRTACLSVLSNVTFHPGLAKSRGFAIPDPSAPWLALYAVTLVTFAELKARNKNTNTATKPIQCPQQRLQHNDELADTSMPQLQLEVSQAGPVNVVARTATG